KLTLITSAIAVMIAAQTPKRRNVYTSRRLCTLTGLDVAIFHVLSIRWTRWNLRFRCLRLLSKRRLHVGEHPRQRVRDGLQHWFAHAQFRAHRRVDLRVGDV